MPDGVAKNAMTPASGLARVRREAGTEGGAVAEEDCTLSKTGPAGL